MAVMNNTGVPVNQYAEMGIENLAVHAELMFQEMKRERERIGVLLGAIVQRLTPEDGHDSPEIGALLLAELGESVMDECDLEYLLEDCLKVLKSKSLAMAGLN